MIQDIQKKTGATISITEVDNSGRVEIFAEKFFEARVAENCRNKNKWNQFRIVLEVDCCVLWECA